MKRAALRLTLMLTMCVVIAGAQAAAKSGSAGSAPAYKAGKILDIEKQEHSHPAGHDAQPASNVDTYHARVQVGSTIYTVRYETHGGSDMDWVKDKEIQVHISGKVMHVKRATGADTKVPILKTEKAPA